MGTKEHCQAVADYLKVAGCDSVDGVFLGIGGIGAGASKAGVRAALKKLGAWGRKTGDWPKRDSEGVPWASSRRYNYRTMATGCPHFPGIVELFRLSPWETAF
jgi:hypothetical protein